MRSTRRIIAAAAGTVMLSAAAIGAWLLWPARAVPLDAPPIELVKFAASDTFASLPDDKKLPYVAVMEKNPLAMITAARDAKLTEEQRRAAFENVMQARWNQMLDEWLKLDAAGRDAYAKKAARDMDAQRAKLAAATRAAAALGMSAKPAQSSSGGGAGTNRRFVSPERQKRIVETMPPNRRAAMSEFLAALHKARGDK
jgi:hypothetical protein